MPLMFKIISNLIKYSHNQNNVVRQHYFNSGTWKKAPLI